MKKENILTFIAIWEESFGTKVVDIYPKEATFDFNIIATLILHIYKNE